MVIYIMCCVVLFLFLGSIWKASDMINVFLKMIFSLGAVVGIMLVWYDVMTMLGIKP